MMRRFKKLVTLLITFLLGIAAFITFNALIPDFDVLQPNPDQVSVSITFEAYASLPDGEKCPVISWQLSPNSGDPITGVVVTRKIDNDDIYRPSSPLCTGSSNESLTKGKAWVLSTIQGDDAGKLTGQRIRCDGIGLVETNISITVPTFGACIVWRQNTVLEKALKSGGFVIPAVAAVGGLVVALVLLRWAVRLLIRPAVWAARRGVMRPGSEPGSLHWRFSSPRCSTLLRSYG